MSAWAARIALALVLGLGLAAAPAGAQQFSFQATPYTGPPSPYAGPARVDPAWFAPPGGPGGEGGPGCNGRCKDFLHRHGMSCWSDHNLPICTSCRAQLDFIFGSCKTFFGEPCLGSRPLVPVPPGYQPFPYGQP